MEQRPEGPSHVLYRVGPEDARKMKQAQVLAARSFHQLRSETHRHARALTSIASIESWHTPFDPS